MRHLTTCGTCGRIIEWYESPDPFIRGPQWRHVTATPGGHTHNPNPDDSAVSGPSRDDLPVCSGCHHPEHGEDGCEEEVSTGLYGTDGVLVPDWCSCTGPVPADAPAVAPDPWTDPDDAAAASPPPF